MNFNYHGLSHPGIQALHPYIPGKSIDEVALEHGLKEIIKLASNENPLGCSPFAQAALNAIKGDQLAIYPSANSHPLRRKLSKKLGVEESMLLLGNGSDSLFSLILIAFALGTQKRILTHKHAFIAYQIQAQTLGIPFFKTPLKADWQVDLDALMNASLNNTAIVFLANPNNPTGTFLKRAELKKLLMGIPQNTLVVLDEAYHEYAYEEADRSSTITLLNDFPNLIITRTFSKAYGLAGLRLGYAIAHPQIIEILLKIHLPFPVNQATLAVVNAALDDEDFLRETTTLNTEGKEQLKQGLESLKLNLLPAYGNFITFDCESASLPIYEKLLQYGIIIRPLQPYGLFHHLRVTIGNPIQNKQFLDKLSLCFYELRGNDEKYK